MTIKNYKNVSIGPIFDMQVDANARKGQQNYTGEAHTFSAVRVDDTRFELWLHDERTKGGVLINPLPNLVDYNNVTMSLGANNVLTITQANGNVVTEDLTALLGPDIHLASLTLVGNTLIATDTDANTFPLDLSSLAFVDAVQLVGNNLTIDFGDGSQTVLDLSGYVNDGVINSFILSGTTATITTSLGQTYAMDMSSLNEVLTDNGDGTYTFDDGEGGSVVIQTATPSAALAVGIDSFGTAYAIGDLIVTYADGSVVVHEAPAVIPPTPFLVVSEDGTTVQAAASQLDFLGADFAITAPAVGVAAVRRKHLEVLATVVITTSQLYTPGPNVAAIEISMCGGGGGSFGVPALSAGAQYATPGGGAGGFAYAFLENPGPANVLIGAGGAAEGIVTQTYYHSGNPGGTTQFAEVGLPILARASGGPGGSYWSPYAAFNYNGTVTHRDHAHFPVSNGTYGVVQERPKFGKFGFSVGSQGGGTQFASAGDGGDSELGSGAKGHNGVGSNWAGSPDATGPIAPVGFFTNDGFGGGASGAHGHSGNTPAVGAAGAQGVCIITEYSRI